MTTAPGSTNIVTEYAPNNLKRAAIVATFFVFLGAAVTLFLAATQWYGAWTPLWIMLAASVPITFVTTVVSTSQEDESSMKKMVPAGLVALFVSLTLGGLGGFTWREEGMRMWALETASARGSYGVLQQAIQSEDTTMASVACGVMLGSSDPTVRGHALDALEKNPTLAGSCLSYPGLAIEQRDVLADLLTDRWYSRIEEIKPKDEVDERACRWAQALSTIEAATTSGDVALLSCAMSAPHEALKDCCASALHKRKVTGSALATRAGAFPYPAYEGAMAATLLATSFESGGLKSAQKMRGTQIAASKAPMRAYALQVACENMTAGVESTPLAKQFYGMANARCKLRAPKLKKNTGFWMGVCATVKRERRALEEVSGSQKKLERKICDYVIGEMSGEALNAARAIVHAGIRVDGESTFSNDSRMLGSINRAATSLGYGHDHKQLHSVNSGQHSFESEDLGYVSDTANNFHIMRRQQEVLKKKDGYDKVHKKAKKMREASGTDGNVDFDQESSQFNEALERFK